MSVEGGFQAFKGRARPAAAVATVLLTGCLDFTAPDARPTVSTRLDLVVRFVDGHPGTVRVHGSFFADPDSLAAAPLEAEEVRVAGVAIEPALRNEVGLHYQTAWELGSPEGPAPDVLIEGVRLAGDPVPPGLRLPLPWRNGPDSLELAAEEDLLLRLRVPESLTGEEATRLGWQLVVRRIRENGSPGAALLRMDREGIPPPALSVPSEWLGEPGRPLRAELTFHAAAERAGTEAGYLMQASLWTETSWHITRP